MDRHWIINNLFVHLNKKVRQVLVKGLLEGPPRPSITYEDYGILPEHFPHPKVGASKIWTDPAEAAALVKNLNKLVKLGAVARPIPLDEDGRGSIMGRPIFMVNSFGVTKDCKTRNVTAKHPITLRIYLRKRGISATTMGGLAWKPLWASPT